MLRIAFHALQQRETARPAADDDYLYTGNFIVCHLASPSAASKTALAIVHLAAASA